MFRAVEALRAGLAKIGAYSRAKRVVRVIVRFADGHSYAGHVDALEARGVQATKTAVTTYVERMLRENHRNKSQVIVYDADAHTPFAVVTLDPVGGVAVVVRCVKCGGYAPDTCECAGAVEAKS